MKTWKNRVLQVLCIVLAVLLVVSVSENNSLKATIAKTSATVVALAPTATSTTIPDLRCMAQLKDPSKDLFVFYDPVPNFDATNKQKAPRVENPSHYKLLGIQIVKVSLDFSMLMVRASYTSKLDNLDQMTEAWVEKTDIVPLNGTVGPECGDMNLHWNGRSWFLSDYSQTVCRMLVTLDDPTLVFRQRADSTLYSQDVPRLAKGTQVRYGGSIWLGDTEWYRIGPDYSNEFVTPNSAALGFRPEPDKRCK